MPADLRLHFPILAEQVHGHPLVWLDNAATTQKPRVVIDAISDYYLRANANVHRASHALSARSTHAFEDARDTVCQFLNARHSDEIIWTRGATEALNLLAWSWGSSTLKAGDEILLSAMEHHANIVPWQLVAERTGATIKVIPITESGELDLAAFQQLLNSNTKVLSVTHVSNALGTINPVKEMIAAAKAVGALTIIDGAQAVAHFPVDMQDLDCDFYVFSGHKVYGPTGIGVLYGRRDLLEAMPPWQGGGEMIDRVSFSGTTFQKPPFRFEAGTPNIAGVIGLAAAINYLNAQDRTRLAQHETMLRLKLEQALDQLPGIRRIGTAQDKTAVVSFVCDHIHNQDLGVLLDQQGIAVRTGHHCTMPLMETLGLKGTVRASLACYNTEADIDHFIAALHTILNETITAVQEHAETVVAFDSEKSELPATFAEAPHFTADGLETLCHQLLKTRNWQDRYRSIMQLANKLPTLPDELRQQETQLSGCESTVWMHHFYDENNQTLHFAIDSDARVIRGLVYILQTALNGRTPASLLSFDMDDLFQQLGLMNHLSPSRGNGLKAIVKEIVQTAHRFL
ncbi:SufS family cysteine desulfurase [Parendozoicomonas haliclonae]|uniref:cysteine desulfurase n=1 Tax=Parendozoicomonas haliclonae TaxID=1960125 RepID=A0A1X7AH17_9GAMM|nr:SufS family cysteine desulfurase [Parendozoicomonas haliclonae]SMA34651.1 Cysteine desulfurase [Parendozoicomonas haliclonae]